MPTASANAIMGKDVFFPLLLDHDDDGDDEEEEEKAEIL